MKVRRLGLVVYRCHESLRLLCVKVSICVNSIHAAALERYLVDGSSTTAYDLLYESCLD